MARHPILATSFFATVAFLCVTFPGPRQSQAAGVEPAKATVKWEYCSVFGDHRGKCGWSKGDAEIFVDSWKALAQKMDVTLKEKDPSDRSIRLAIFNHLGAQGWELVSHSTMVSDATYAETFMFKRRVE
jgi:hypothetical protein